jgi:UDPglucose--hexose-1-phosphate uridylyltransferase
MEMQRARIEHADGRYLLLYAFERPLPDLLDVEPPARDDDLVELRFNPLLGEYVIISTGRQGRTFLPLDEHCPLCPTSPEGIPTEIPAADFEIAVFENRFPSFRIDAPDVADESALERRVRANGACEVVVYTPRHDASLGSLAASQARHLVDVWTERYDELSSLEDVRYVFIFENRGKEIGVTLTHPHGQIYAFPFVPPRVLQEQAAAMLHERKHGTCLLCDVVAEEVAHGRRIVAEAPGFVAYVPFAARMPYEVHVAATAHRPSLLDLRDAERDGLASVLRDVQRAYDALWGFAMPYTMSMHQRSTDGVERPGEHLHIEFMPPYRTRDRLKYLASVETGAGTFINDTSPEEKAAELRAALARVGTGG